MSMRNELAALHQLIISDEIDQVTEDRVEVDIAALLGWKNIKFDKWVPGWRGDDPVTGERKVIPRFMSSYDAAVTVVPDLWVEGYYKRFDGMVVAHCHPRGDLEKERETETTPSVARSILAVAILARIAMAED
jgi:hypothetical protein